VGLAWITSLAVAGCIIGLVVRYRRGDAELRQQIKWLAFAASGAGVSLARHAGEPCRVQM
jgi:hypothetical protein